MFEEVPAPSVITFNTQLAAGAATDFMLMMCRGGRSSLDLPFVHFGRACFRRLR